MFCVFFPFCWKVVTLNSSPHGIPLYLLTNLVTVFDLPWCYVFVQRSNDGMTYYSFEFLAKASNFTRHGLGTVAIKDGTTSFYSRVVTRISNSLKVWKSYGIFLIESCIKLCNSEHQGCFKLTVFDVLLICEWYLRKDVLDWATSWISMWFVQENSTRLRQGQMSGGGLKCRTSWRWSSTLLSYWFRHDSVDDFLECRREESALYYLLRMWLSFLFFSSDKAH